MFLYFYFYLNISKPNCKMVIQNSTSNSNGNGNGNGNNINEPNFNKKQFWTYERFYEKGHRGGSNKGGISKHKSKINKKTIKSKHSKHSKHSKSTTKKKIFHLVDNKVATDKTLVKRLESIYIPPAYNNIVVAKSAGNKIQAIGTDDRGRRQYVYNHKYTQKRNDRKYDFIVPLGKKIIQIERDNDKMLKEMHKKKYDTWSLPDDYIPIIIYMLRTYHFRIGNEKYAIENNSYGITTLKKEHIKFDSSDKKITIEFIGKKGVLNKFSDDNPIIIDLLKILCENADVDGFLFKYNHNGNKQLITPEHIHYFFQDKYKAEITPKMFRTWYGNYHMLEHLHDLFKEGKLKQEMTKGEINKIITGCGEHVSSKLNNTPTVSKQSYIDNKILDLVKKDPYKLASKIPGNSKGQHRFLADIIHNLRHKDKEEISTNK